MAKIPACSADTSSAAAGKMPVVGAAAPAFSVASDVPSLQLARGVGECFRVCSQERHVNLLMELAEQVTGPTSVFVGVAIIWEADAWLDTLPDLTAKVVAVNGVLTSAVAYLTNGQLRAPAAVGQRCGARGR